MNSSTPATNLPKPQLGASGSWTPTPTPGNYLPTAPAPAPMVGPQQPAPVARPVAAPVSAQPMFSQAQVAANQQSDLQKYFPGLAAPTSMSSQNYSINPGPTIASSSANPATTTQDALSAAASARQSLLNGTASANKVPSDGLYGSVINGIFNSSQYSPQEVSALDQYNQTQAKIIQTQLAARRQILDLQQNGAITKAEGAGFLSESQRRSDAQLADLAASQAGNTLSLQTLGMLRQNQLGAYQNIAGLIKPEQLAPGSSLVNPITGQATANGMGASPQVVAQQAATFISQDEATGNLQINSDGTINQAYYQNKAQSYYQNGLIPGATSQSGGAALPGGSTTSPGLPPNIANQPYVIPATSNTPQYINLGRVPPGQQQYVATVAGQNGIPVLSADDASNVQGIQYTQNALKPLEEVMNKTLLPGILGRGANIVKNTLNNIFQNQPDLVAFNQARSTAIKVIQSLAAGSGSGFRLTQPEIETATSNMPNATDNLETAQTKLAYVKSFLTNELNLKITGNANNYTAPKTGGSSSSNSSSIFNF